MHRVLILSVALLACSIAASAQQNGTFRKLTITDSLKLRGISIRDIKLNFTGTSHYNLATQQATYDLVQANKNHVWLITNLSDTTGVTSEIEGDIAYVSSGDTLAIRDSLYWLVFTGGGGGGGTFDDWTAAADSGTPAVISDGETVTFSGGTGLSSAISGNTVTTNLENTAVTAGSYGSATQVPGYTVDAQGRLTAASNTSIQIAQSQVTGLADSISSAPSGTGTNLRIPVWTGTNSLGSSTLLQSDTGQTLDANLAFRLTGGTTASRPTGAAGHFYYNTSNNWFDFHNGTNWFNPLRSSTATGLGTAGRVFYADANGAAAADDVLFWDATNNKLGVNNTSPSSTLSIGTDGGYNGGLYVAAGTSGRVVNFANVFEFTNTGTAGWVGQGLSVVGTNRALNFIVSSSNVTDGTLLSFKAGSAAAAFGSPTSGARFFAQFGENLTWGPTSGTASYTILGVYSQIAQGGTASGSITGIDYNPTLTSVLGTHYGLIIRPQTLNGFGTASPDRLLHPELSGSATNAIGYPFRASHITSGTAAAGFGAGIEFEAESAGGTNRVSASIENPYTTATNAAEVSDLVIKTMRAGTLTESLRSLGNGTLQVATLSGTATQLGGYTAGNIATAVTLGAGLSFTSGTLNGAFLPLTLSGATEVNTAGQSLYIRDAADYPYAFWNSSAFVAASDINTFIQVGGTSGWFEANAATRAFISSAGSAEMQAATELRLDADSIVIDATLPVNTNATHVLVRDASTKRLEEYSLAQSFFNDYDTNITLTGVTTTADTIDADSNTKSNDWGFNPTTNTYTYNGITGKYYKVSISAQVSTPGDTGEIAYLEVYRNGSVTSARAQAYMASAPVPFAAHGQTILLLSNGDTINAKISSSAGAGADFDLINYSLIVEQI